MSVCLRYAHECLCAGSAVHFEWQRGCKVQRWCCCCCFGCKRRMIQTWEMHTPNLKYTHKHNSKNLAFNHGNTWLQNGKMWMRVFENKIPRNWDLAWWGFRLWTACTCWATSCIHCWGPCLPKISTGMYSVNSWLQKEHFFESICWHWIDVKSVLTRNIPKEKSA